MTDLWAPVQILSYAAVLLIVLSYQWRVPRTAIAIQVVGQAIMATHLFWLGATTGAAQVTAASFRDAIAVRAPKNWLLAVSAAYLVFAWINVAITAQVWLDIAPAVATSVMTTTLLLRDNPFGFRLVSLAGVWLWCVYFAAVGSYGGLLQSALLTGSIAVAMWRYDRGGMIPSSEGPTH